MENFLEKIFDRTGTKVKAICVPATEQRLKALGLWKQIDALEKEARAIVATGDNARIMDLRTVLNRWEEATFSALQTMVKNP
jgi:hypothetical protein